MDLPNGKYLIDVRKDCTREEMFTQYAHELRHIKQNEISYRARREQFLEGYKPHAIDNLKRNNLNATDEAINDFIQTQVKPFFDKMWNKYPKINSGTKEYELAQNFNAAQKNYYEQTQAALVADSKQMYRLNFLEDDAIIVEEAMGRLYKLLNN